MTLDRYYTKHHSSYVFDMLSYMCVCMCMCETEYNILLLTVSALPTLGLLYLPFQSQQSHMI